MKPSPLADFIRNATPEQKQDVYSKVMRKVSISQAQVIEAAKKQAANDRFLRRKQVETMTGLPTSTLYVRIAQGTFPKAVKIGVKSAAWLESEVRAWMQERVNERDKEAL